MNNNIVLIRFSSREKGNCAAISDEIRQLYCDDSVVQFTVDANVVQPCSNCNYECLTPNLSCPNISKEQAAVMKAVCGADLVYYIIPNYCGYPCSNFLVFNEKSVGFFNGDRTLMKQYMNTPKRFIVVSNTEGDQFINALQMQSKEKPEVLYMKTGKYGKKSIAGDIMESEAALNDLKAFIMKDRP